MAGIFANVDSDIKKLQYLRQEIDNIKKALKGINVKVDIDIAKGLKAQLKGLTDQYNALAAKVAETETRIAASASRITDASKKIIQAQEQLAKAASPVGQSFTPGGGTNAAETANVKAQAKAYDELKEEIDKVLGSREANIKRLIEEQNAIRLINEEIKKLNKLQGTSGESTAQQNRLAQLNNDLLTHKTALSELRQALNNSAKLDNAAATSMDALSQSLSRMRVLYRQITEEERNSPFGKELLTSIQQADAKIKELDATIGNHQRNVGNYASGFNGLNMSIQQIGRELPSLAMGWDTFFLAISNNLPILTDEIKRAKDEYKTLVSHGQKATPVWKQIVSSLVSWQTALTVGITLLTLYGEELIDWASSLIKGKKALSETYQATEEFQKSVSESAGKSIVAYEKLAKTWSSLGNDIKAQEKFILEYKSDIDSLGVSITNISDAEKIFNDGKNDFIAGLQARAEAVALMDLASQEYVKYFQKMEEADNIKVNWKDRIMSALAQAGLAQSGQVDLLSEVTPEKAKEKRKSDLEKEAGDYKASFDKLVQKAIDAEKEGIAKIEKAGADLTNELVAGSVEAIEKSISLKRDALKKVTNRFDYIKTILR